jgi:hypothetical protein
MKELLKDVLKTKHELEGSVNALVANGVDSAMLREALRITTMLLSSTIKEELITGATNFLIGLIDITVIRGAINRNTLVQWHLEYHADFINNFEAEHGEDRLSAPEYTQSIVDNVPLGNIQIWLGYFLRPFKCFGSVSMAISPSGSSGDVPRSNINDEYIYRTGIDEKMFTGEGGYFAGDQTSS